MFVNCHTLAVAFWLSLNVTFLTLPLFMSIFIFSLEYSTKLIRSLHPFLAHSVNEKPSHKALICCLLWGLSQCFSSPHTEEKADNLPE